jgi:hypothetical protein
MAVLLKLRYGIQNYHSTVKGQLFPNANNESVACSQELALRSRADELPVYGSTNVLATLTGLLVRAVMVLAIPWVLHLSSSTFVA